MNSNHLSINDYPKNSRKEKKIRKFAEATGRNVIFRNYNF